MSIKPREENNDESNKNFDNRKINYRDKLREQKAKIILSRDHAIRKVNNNIYTRDYPQNQPIYLL